MKLTTIIVFLVPVVVARHHHGTLLENILTSKGNFFTTVNQDFQNVVNNLFDALNIYATFATKTRIKLLLTMHYDLNRISEKNYDVYEKLKDITKIDTNKTANKTDLLELIGEILNDKHFNLSGGIKEENYTRKHTKYKAQNDITESEFRDSKEFKEFIRKFVNKVDKLSIDDFSKRPDPPDFDSEENDDNYADDDLKVWEPPSVIELDYVNDTTRRIFRGTKTRIKSYPFVVSVHIMQAFACAGSIISRDLIITAASCLQLIYNNRFYRENPRSVFVRIGSDYYAHGGEKITVIETYFHPSYDPKTLKNNLVILRLQTIIKFLRNKKRVRRILYDRKAHHLSTNTEGIIIVGWGPRQKTQVLDPFQKLLVAQLDIYHITECADIYSKLYVTSLHFCAGFVSSGGGACNKDVGGPGIVSGKLIGVVSFGPPICGTTDSPTVFTKVGFYAKWIDSIMRLRPPVVGVRTTLYRSTAYRYRYLNTKNYRIRYKITPVTEQSLRAKTFAHTETQNLTALKHKLEEIAITNKTLLHDLLYGESMEDEDFKEVFSPDTKVPAYKHPLVNKSLFVIPGIHDEIYVTLPTTQSAKFPSNDTGPTSTTPTNDSLTQNTKQTTRAKKRHHLRKPTTTVKNIYESDYYDDYDTMTQMPIERGREIDEDYSDHYIDYRVPLEKGRNLEDYNYPIYTDYERPLQKQREIYQDEIYPKYTDQDAPLVTERQVEENINYPNYDLHRNAPTTVKPQRQRKKVRKHHFRHHLHRNKMMLRQDPEMPKAIDTLELLEREVYSNDNHVGATPINVYDQ